MNSSLVQPADATRPWSSPRYPRWAAPALVLALSLGASLPVLMNNLVQDDRPIFIQNPSVHRLSTIAVHFRQPYWPMPFSPDLYRPLSSVLFTLEWVVSQGRAWFIHGVSVALYAAVCLAVLALSRRLLPPRAALGAAALFAVHPVHVESIGAAVNQSELAAALCVILAVCVYLDWRATHTAPSGRLMATLTGAYAVGCLFKESGIVLPGLLAAAELTLVRDPRPLSARLRQLWLPALLLALTGAGFIALRTHILGSVAGTFSAEAFRGLTVAQRALTMLGVVPEWVRLLLWPAHLQADYSPQEIMGATSWGWGQTLGLTILAPTAILTLIGVRRNSVASFGVLWAAIALFPVSNLLLPTGIVLAERTLFLPSVGVALALGAGLAMLATRLEGATPRVRLVSVAALGLLVLAGGVRSAIRYPAWHDTLSFTHQSVEDAPTSYRARAGLGEVMFYLRQKRTGERYLREAIRLYPEGYPTYQILADHYRLADLCGPAIPLYHQALELAPKAADVRASLIACQVHAGDYRGARDAAAGGIAEKTWPEMFRGFQRTADSAIAAAAPPGTVHISVPDSAGSRKEVWR
jgi:hypothetical protein